MALAISIVGPSGSGKTELICRLLAWFATQGLKVAVLKHSHKLNLADDGKDTGRFRRAGAQVVALAAPGLLQITHSPPGDPPLREILAALAPQADLILVEGYKTGPLPKLALLAPGNPDSRTDYPQLIALVSPEPLQSSVPVFQPHQVAELGRFLQQYLGLG